MNFCSVRVPSLLVWWRHSHFTRYQDASMSCSVSQSRKNPFHLIAAPLSAAPQTITKTFWNGWVKMWNELWTFLVSTQFLPSFFPISPHFLKKPANVFLPFKHKLVMINCLQNLFFLRNIWSVQSLCMFQLWKLFVSNNFLNKHYSDARKSTLMSKSDGLGPHVFSQKKRKTRSLRNEMDRKVFFLARVMFSAL